MAIPAIPIFTDIAFTVLPISVFHFWQNMKTGKNGLSLVSWRVI